VFCPEGDDGQIECPVTPIDPDALVVQGARLIYDRSDGSVTFDLFAPVGILAIESKGQSFDPQITQHLMLGSESPVLADETRLAWFNASGLPMGIHPMGPLLPPGLSLTDLLRDYPYSYTPLGHPPGTIGKQDHVVLDASVPEATTWGLLVCQALAILVPRLPRRRMQPYAGSDRDELAALNMAFPRA
jgi:hypothetical protein